MNTPKAIDNEPKIAKPLLRFWLLYKSRLYLNQNTPSASSNRYSTTSSSVLIVHPLYILDQALLQGLQVALRTLKRPMLP